MSPFVITGGEASVGLHGGVYDDTEEFSGVSLKVTKVSEVVQTDTEIREQCETR